VFHNDEPFKTADGVLVDVMRQDDVISVTFADYEGAMFTARLTPQENARLGMLLSIASLASAE
jgi:hypothetical protein